MQDAYFPYRYLLGKCKHQQEDQSMTELPLGDGYMGGVGHTQGIVFITLKVNLPNVLVWLIFSIIYYLFKDYQNNKSMENVENLI